MIDDLNPPTDLCVRSSIARENLQAAVKAWFYPRTVPGADYNTGGRVTKRQ